MEEKFKLFLKSEGYSEYTPSGHPSTIYDYVKRVNRVIEAEGLTWNTLPQCINRVVQVYDVGGAKEDIGRKSHNAVINALWAYQRFVKTL